MASVKYFTLALLATTSLSHAATTSNNPLDLLNTKVAYGYTANDLLSYYVIGRGVVEMGLPYVSMGARNLPSNNKVVRNTHSLASQGQKYFTVTDKSAPLARAATSAVVLHGMLKGFDTLSSVNSQLKDFKPYSDNAKSLTACGVFAYDLMNGLKAAATKLK